MKTLIFILCLVSAYGCEAQGKWDDSLIGKPIWKVKPLPMEGNEIVYSGHINLNNYSKDRLFKNALDWYNDNYKSADSRLTVENKEQGTVSGTGVIHVQSQRDDGPGNFFFSFSVQIGSAGYSYRIYDIYSAVAGAKNNYNEMYREEQYPNAKIKERWTHKYRYEALSDMDSFITLAINLLIKDMEKP
jgi:hypothetical protein